MEPSKAKWSLYSLGRRRPYLLVLISGLFLLLSAIPDSSLAFLSLIAFVPLFILFEVFPLKVPEDKIFYPFKAAAIVLFRLLTLQFLWRRGTRTFHYERKLISGNAQLFRFTYLAFFIRNAFFSWWIIQSAFDPTLPGDSLNRLVAGLTALFVIPALQALPFQFYSRMRHVFAPVAAALAGGVIFVAFEFLYLRWTFNWPWMALGNTFNYQTFFIQFASISGALGVTLYIFLANAAFYQLWRYARGMVSGRKLLLWLLIPPLPLAFYWQAPFPGGVGEPLRICLISPDLEVRNPDNLLTRSQQMERLLELIPADSSVKFDLLVYPEMAISKPLRKRDLRSDPLLDSLWVRMRRDSFYTIMGFREIETFADEEESPWEARRVLRNKKWVWEEEYHSVALLGWERPDSLGDSLPPARPWVRTRRKMRRALFTETLPMGNFLRWLAGRGVLLSDPDHIGKGDSVHPLIQDDHVAIGVMMGIEGAYASIVGNLWQRSALLLWLQEYGDYHRQPGYFFDAGMARLRALEMGSSLWRLSDDNGVEWILPDGRVYAKVPAGEILLAEYHWQCYGGSFYAWFGDWLGWGALILSLILVFVAVFREYRRRKS